MASPLDGLAKTVGKAFSKIVYDAVLTRPGPPSGPAYDPTPGTPLTFKCKAIAVAYSGGMVGQGLVASTDVNVLILAATLATDPRPLDQITIAKQRFSATIVPADTAGLQAVKTDPARATWQCRATN